MAENALRNLQIFRNGALLTGTMSDVKALIEQAYADGNLVLRDGEPISVRYHAAESDEVKGLLGVAYNNGTTKKILWSGSATVNSIETTPQENALVTLNHTEDAEGNVTLTVAAHTHTVADATDDNDGLATAKDVKDYVDGIKVKKLETAEDGYVASYQVVRGEGDDAVVLGDTINIPKDFLVKSGEIKTVETVDTPYEGAAVGDKYLDFVINVKEGTATDEHMYVALKDIITLHTQVEGEEETELNNTDYVNVKATTDADTSVVTLSSSIKTVELEDATEENDGIATANDVRTYVDGHMTTVSAGTDNVTVEAEENEDGHVNYKISVEDTTDRAVVERNVASDSLNVTTEGTLNQDAIAVIEKYIDNYDCGTFELTVNSMANELNDTISNAEAGTETNVNNDINVSNDEGTITINSNN